LIVVRERRGLVALTRGIYGVAERNRNGSQAGSL